MTPGEPIPILVVDDDEAQTMLLKKFLEKHGYRVFTSNNPIEAVAVLSQHPVKLVITDLMMPWIDGIAFTQQIHAKPGFENLPVILITAYPSEEISEKGLRKGIAMTLSKPIELSKLLDLVGFATH